MKNKHWFLLRILTLKAWCLICTMMIALASDENKLAPVNPYNGMQEREEVFEFTEKPKVTKEGNKWVITFASKGKCDATVAIIGPDGTVVRHLASGVLGKNAPWPFQQNSLSQKIEWDGQDDMGRPAPGGCKVKVGLGLKAKFERNIAWNPYFIPSGQNIPEPFQAQGTNGELFILAMHDSRIAQGRVFKSGQYVRTFWPPSAKDMEKTAQAFADKRYRGHWQLVKTVWGDTVPVSEDRYGIVSMKEVILGFENLAKVVFPMVGLTEYKKGAAPAEVSRPAADWDGSWFYEDGDGGEDCPRMAADRYREEVYFGNHKYGLRRMDGRTGKLDTSFYPDGALNKVTECHVGPDGNLYIGFGYLGYLQYIMRLDHNGKPIDFGGDAVPLPKGWPGKWHDTGEPMGMSPRPKAFVKEDIKVLWTGLRGHSNTHERGLFVSPRGYILAHILQGGSDIAWSVKHGVPASAAQTKGAGSFIRVWSNDGNLLTANAVGDMGTGHGVAMDRDGNIYAAIGQIWPASQKYYDGLVDVAPAAARWGGYGSLLKFRGGPTFPLGRTYYKEEKDVPATALKVSGRYSAVDGALWMWGGLICQTDGNCSCHQVRYDMDYFARHWIPANQVYSVMVIDANGNRIVRLGRYGNVDDTEEDIKAGGDGLRFAWPRALCVSDTALYVCDHGNRRILKAKIYYVVEETIPIF